MNKLTYPATIAKTLCFLTFLFTTALTAQSYAVADSTWLSVYNTGKRYQLKNAPFGEKNPKKEIIYNMVFSADTIEPKNKNNNDVNARPLTLAEIKLKVVALAPNLTSPRQLTAQEIENEKNNQGKRTCEIAINGLKGTVVLIDFDKNCDPTYKCLQAQRAGAIVAVVIYDTDRKDSIAMARGRYADSLRIPCFSITRSQGDSVRAMLPSRVGLFTPKVQTASLQQSAILTFNAYKLDQIGVLEWENKTQSNNETFIIERSADGQIFTKWREIEEHTTTNSLKTYTLDDTEPLEDDNYYRLILKHPDGTSQTTAPRLLKFPALRDFDFYPNPATHELNIHLKQFEKKAIDLTIFDAVGKQIYTEHIDQVSANIKTLDLAKLHLSGGSYTISVLYKGQAFTKRFMLAR